MFDQEEPVKKMIAAGASGYILKNTPLARVLTAIRQLAHGKTYFDVSLPFSDSTAIEQRPTGKLTKRQRQILQLIAQGKSSREIGEALFIGVYTVDTHRKNMARILGLKGKGELLRYAVERKYDF